MFWNTSLLPCNRALPVMNKGLSKSHPLLLPVVFFSGKLWSEFYFFKMAAIGTKEKRGPKLWKFIRKLSINSTNSPIQTLNLLGCCQVMMMWAVDLIKNPHLHHPQCTFVRMSISLLPFFLHSSWRRSPVKALISFFFLLGPAFQWCHVASQCRVCLYLPTLGICSG
jgi:hypothetical protein